MFRTLVGVGRSGDEVSTPGNHEHASAHVGRPAVEGRYAEGMGVVTEHVQIAPHLRQPELGAARDVLDNADRWPLRRGDPETLEPELAVFPTFDALPLARGRDVLTRKPEREHVDVGERARIQKPHVAEARDAREALGQDRKPEHLALALEEKLDLRIAAETAVKAEIEPADPGEKGAELLLSLSRSHARPRTQ